MTDVFFFSDNTVLVNFGYIDRLDVLRSLLNDRGRWCATVADECRQSASVPGLEALGDVASLLGEAERPTPAELINTRLLRDSMAAPGEGARAHLGEAETVAIMESRFRRSFFVTDDGGARIVAEGQGLRVISTWDLLRAAFRAGLLTEAELWAPLERLRQLGRGHPPKVWGYTSFKEWITVSPSP